MTLNEFIKEVLKKKKYCKFTYISVEVVDGDMLYDADHPIIDKAEYDFTNNYYILNPHQAPIDWSSGVKWFNAFQSGAIEGCLVATKEQLYKYYSKQQADEIIDYCDKKAREYLCIE